MNTRRAIRVAVAAAAVVSAAGCGGAGDPLPRPQWAEKVWPQAQSDFLDGLPQGGGATVFSAAECAEVGEWAEGAREDYPRPEDPDLEAAWLAFLAGAEGYADGPCSGPLEERSRGFLEVAGRMAAVDRTLDAE